MPANYPQERNNRLISSTVKKNTLGRSMVEMLGVLAIVGVLSVGAIAGYHFAINKYRSNEIWNEASKRALSASAQFEQGAVNVALGDFNNDLGYVTFGDVASEINEKQFQLTLSQTGGKIDTMICANLKSMRGDDSYVRAIADDCSALVYNKDLSTKKFASRGQDGTCLAGFGGDNCDEECDSTKPVISVTGACYSCASSEAIATSKTECDRCPDRSYSDGICHPAGCGEGKFLYSGFCYDCNEPTAIVNLNFRNNPELCPPCRMLTNNGIICAPKTCPADKPFRDGRNGCFSCDELNPVFTSEEQCNNCPERYWQARYCHLKGCPAGYFYRKNLGCVSCDAVNDNFNYAVDDAGKECAEKCGSKREVYTDEYGNTQCIPKACAKGYFKNKQWGCVSCSYPGSPEVFSEADCASCNDTVSPRKLDINGRCVLKEN